MRNPQNYLLLWLFALFTLFSFVSSQEVQDIAIQSPESTEEDNPSSTEDTVIPPIYVVSLERAKVRWESAKQQMTKAGLNVTRLAAIDGRQLSSEELQRYSTSLAVLLQPRGVIGCFLSHRKFWQLVVDQKLPAAIVFEDDVHLVDNFKEKLVQNLIKLQQDNISYDVLLLGAIGKVNYYGKDGIGPRLFSGYVGGSKKLRRINEYIYQPSRPAGTHAYMISYEGAKKLLELCPKAVFHVDLVAWSLKEIEMRMFHPMLAYQTFEETTLTDVSHSRGVVADRLVNSRAVQTVNKWAVDPTTLQPLSHMLAEPLLKIGLHGPVLTVERHLVVVLGGVAASLIAFQLRLYSLAYSIAGVSTAFTVVVRTIISVLMRSK